MTKVLKNPDIKIVKPNLQLKPNHYHFISTARLRVWPGSNGQAISNGKGWYKKKG